MSDIIPQDDTPKRYCRQCQAYKPITDFHNFKNPRALCKFHYRETRKNRKRDYTLEYKKHGLGRVRNYYPHWRHLITPEEYETLFNKQFGLCAICGKPPKQGRRLCLDHCHKSGVVRQLLCDACNHLLGCAQDNPEILRKAIDYLKLHLT